MRFLSCIGLILCCAVLPAAAHDEDTYNPTVYLFYCADGSAYADITLLAPPPDEGELFSAWRAAFPGINVEPTVEYDSGEDYSYWWIEGKRVGPASDPALIYNDRIELDALRTLLLSLGYRGLDINIGIPFTPIAETDWIDWENCGYYGAEYRCATLPLDKDHPLPTMVVSYGYAPVHVTLLVLLGIALLLLPHLLSLLFLRGVRALPPEAAGWASFSAQRTYAVIGLITWIVGSSSIVATGMHQPLIFLVPALAPLERVISLAFTIVIPLVGTVSAHRNFHPILMAFPGAKWTRRDLLLSAVAVNGMLLCATVILPLALGGIEAGNFGDVGLIMLLGLVGGILFFVLGHAVTGMRVEPLGDGLLSERIHALGEKAGLDKVMPFVIYLPKMPHGNALAANGNRVMVTDFLLKQLPRRAVDALLAHEMTHLQANHPQRLMRSVILYMFLAGFIGAILFATGQTMLESYAPRLANMPPLLLWVALLIGFSIAYALQMRRSQRFEWEADAGALELSEDPEALIAGLARITQMNRMPFQFKGRKQRWLTHPGTRARLDAIAAAGKISVDRVDELIRDGLNESDHYLIPESAREDLIFSTQVRTLGLLLVMFGTIVLPPLVTLATAVLSTHYGLDGITAWIVAGLGLAVACVTLIGFLATGSVRQFRVVERQLREKFAKYDAPVPDDAVFVSFSPGNETRVYGGYSNYDMGFLYWDDACLHYRGEKARFSLPRDEIRALESRPEYVSIPTAKRLVVTWQEGEAHPCAQFAAASVGSIMASVRETLALQRELEAWLTGHAEPTGESYEAAPGPEDITDSSSVLITPSTVLKAVLIYSVISALVGLVLAWMLGLDPYATLPRSAWYPAIAAVCSQWIVFLPRAMRLRR